MQLSVLHLHLGITKVVAKATSKLNFQCTQGFLKTGNADVLQLILCTFQIEDVPPLTSQVWQDDRATIRYGSVWLSLPNLAHFHDEAVWTEQEQWLLFLQQAAALSAVPDQITTPAVKAAFQAARLENWPASDKEWYEENEADLPQRLERVKELYREKDITLDERYLERSSGTARLNFNLLKKQLNLYPARSVKASEIDLTAYPARDRTAYALFRTWTVQAQQQYPDRQISIKD